MKHSYTIDETGIMLHSLPTEKLDLLLAWLDNSFRVCVCGNQPNEIIFFRHYTFHQTHNFNDALHELKAIVSSDVLFANVYRQVKIGISGRMELTPKDFYKNTEALHISSEIATGEIVGAIAIDHAVQEFYNAFFPNAHYELLPLKWLEYVSPKGDAQKLFVQIDGNLLHIAYFRAPDKLQFYNTFEFKASEDFAYFTNLVAQNLELKGDETELVLSGDVAQPSKIYDIAFAYFQKILFLQNNTVEYSSLFTNYPKHQNIALFSL